jgi:hypothetical protein
MNEENINRNKKKHYYYAWIALILSLFFWVPILNIVLFLPSAIYLSIKQIMLAKKEPERYGSLIFPILILVHSTFSIIVSTYILYISATGKL